MNLKLLNDDIIRFLSTLNAKDLPNLPNITGIFEQTEITFAIVSGSKSDDSYFMDVKVNFSIAATVRKDNEIDSECFKESEKISLYNLVQDVIYKLHKRKVTGGKLLLITDFELFTPESGKWRALLSSQVSIPISSEVDNNENCNLFLGIN